MDAGYFDRRVFAEIGLAPQSIVEFDSLIKDKGQEFLEELDNWFVSKEKKDMNHPERKHTGLIMVHYVVEGDEEKDLRDVLVERGLDRSSVNDD